MADTMLGKMQPSTSFRKSKQLLEIKCFRLRYLPSPASLFPDLRSSLEEDQPSTSVPELGSTCSGEWSAIYLSAQQQKQLQRQHGIPHGLHCLPQSHGQCTNLPQRLMISWFRNRKHAAGCGPKATLWQAMTRFKSQQVYVKPARLIVIWNSDTV